MKTNKSYDFDSFMNPQFVFDQLLELLVPIIIVLMLPFIAIPQFTEISKKARSAAASKTVEAIAKECLERVSNKDLVSTFVDVELSDYKLYPLDGNCNGDENNLIKAKSNNTKKYPTYSYNVKTGKKSCSHDGPIEELFGCSARRDGEWR